MHLTGQGSSPHKLLEERDLSGVVGKVPGGAVEHDRDRVVLADDGFIQADGIERAGKVAELADLRAEFLQRGFPRGSATYPADEQLTRLP